MSVALSVACEGPVPGCLGERVRGRMGSAEVRAGGGALDDGGSIDRGCSEASRAERVTPP